MISGQLNSLSSLTLATAKIRSFIELLKVRLSLLVAFSCAFGYGLATQGRIDWMVLSMITLGGFLLIYPLFYYHRLRAVTNFDSGISGKLSEDAEPEKKFLNRILKLNIEFVSGLVLFGILNLMLLILNTLDLNYLWFDGKLPEGIQHRQFVHDGIGVLITSLICAILIILFYFRGRLNYYPKNKFLKALAYFWILQNIFMIFSNAYRNNMYIEDAGISYKKIGVYVYLGLTLIGLISTFIKVSKLKSNMFLFRVNPWCYYLILVISSMFNWDVMITDFK